MFSSKREPIGDPILEKKKFSVYFIFQLITAFLTFGKSWKRKSRMRIQHSDTFMTVRLVRLSCVAIRFACEVNSRARQPP